MIIGKRKEKRLNSRMNILNIWILKKVRKINGYYRKRNTS